MLKQSPLLFIVAFIYPTLTFASPAFLNLGINNTLDLKTGILTQVRDKATLSNLSISNFSQTKLVTL
ncbi:MAG: hypothetical protein A3F17_03890 [Gammaproteobacteria bacterium RIFCSPHIGHO2_12_FULL_41_15]|nr:MAG: hypothetical protein A3F17_03890 [Gammaproteobacteria bacterium RIFCSPHIGHO2_12_FULL_41_15]